jgi:hypothetical protein
MPLTRLGVLGLLAFMAVVCLARANLVGFMPLQSRAAPFYSTKHSGFGVVAFFQNDGAVTFLRSSGLGRASNFTCHIGSAHQGSAYAVTGAGSSTVRLLVAQGDRLFQLSCSASTGSCDPQFPIVPLPMTPQNNILDMKPVDGQEDLIYMTTIDSFFVFSSSAMKTLGSYKWSGKPYMTQYSMDRADIVPSKKTADGQKVLISLSGAQPTYQHGSLPGFPEYPQSMPYTRPGMVIALRVSQEGYSVSLITTTLLDTSPMALHIPNVLPDNHIIYWTQIRNDSKVAYVNSFGGWPNSPTIHIPLSPNVGLSSNDHQHLKGKLLLDSSYQKSSSNLPYGTLSLSPSCFGEYPATGAGLLSVGNRNSSQGFYGLYFAYGQDLPPEIILTDVAWNTAPAGAMLFAQQPSSMLPYVHGVVETPDGHYAIETFDFAGMGKPPKNHPKSRNFKNNQVSNKISDKISTETGAFTDNCVRSNCAFAEPGDCPPDHCWSFGANSGFFCCRRPPF